MKNFLENLFKSNTRLLFNSAFQLLFLKANLTVKVKVKVTG